MKKPIVFLSIVLSVSALNAQQKHALVIGNSNYTGISKLNNPVNDANDMETALQGLGFTVDKVINGNLDQMETAVLDLKRRLGASRNTYGFFFYAGHGVQANGENYLIPITADNIRSETQLRERAVSLQFVLDSLNESGNELNMIVLDACRDNPFGWARSGSRGLSMVSRAPTGSIVMYAAGAGQQASDGTGRNGLFTGYLLNNLGTPGLSVFDVFDRTMGNVINSTNGDQHPELSLRFAGASSTYLGLQPAGNVTQAPQQPQVSQQPQKPKQPASATMYPNGLHFSTGRKVGAGFLNMLFGLGSFTMGDLKGGWFILGLEAGGLLFGSFTSSSLHDIDKGLGGVIICAGLATGVTIGFIRPFSYDKEISKENGTYYTNAGSGFSQNPLNNISLVPVPVSCGGMGLGLFYNTSF
jgi:hypothetical protein